jgi:hypothetical protein
MNGLEGMIRALTWGGPCPSTSTRRPPDLKAPKEMVGKTRWPKHR